MDELQAGAPLGMCGALDSTSPRMSAPMGVRDAGFSTNGHLKHVPSSCSYSSL